MNIAIVTYIIILTDVNTKPRSCQRCTIAYHWESSQVCLGIPPSPHPTTPTRYPSIRAEQQCAVSYRRSDRVKQMQSCSGRPSQAFPFWRLLQRALWLVGPIGARRLPPGEWRLDTWLGDGGGGERKGKRGGGDKREKRGRR